MSTLAELTELIQTKRARLAVIGLGYVGLAVACEFASAGFDVLGIEIRKERVDQINHGVSPIKGNEPDLADLIAEAVSSGRLRATTECAGLVDRDIVLIDVETPVHHDRHPRYEALRSALSAVGPNLKVGSLVIIESTIAPGTIDRLVRPLLEETTKRTVNTGFFLGHCPERVMPGRLLANLRGIGRVVGGMNPETADAMVALYRHIVCAELDPTDPLTAEIVKTAENAYRDVQIAFANEMALICEAIGGDVWQVRELVNKTPHRNMHLPGAGVGGHCLPKDPWLLIANLPPMVQARLIPTARLVNDEMPHHIAEMIFAALQEAGVEITQSRVIVLGYAYLQNSDDARNSPSAVLIQRLREKGVTVVAHDPHVPGFAGDLQLISTGADALVLMVAHETYRALDLAALQQVMKHPILVDGRNAISSEAARAVGWKYLGLGRSHQRHDRYS
jgi:UDP-N-acetyl-D-mannosaminuronic acid dehydrogenase